MIASPIYVGLQVKHNNQIAQGQATTTRLTGQITTEVAMMGNDGAAALARAFYQPAKLTAREVAQVWTYLYSVLLSIQNSYEMFELGLSDAQDWERAKCNAPFYLGFPVGRVWWQESKGAFSEKFSAEIDDALSAVDSDVLKAQYDRILTAVRRLPEDDPSM